MFKKILLKSVLLAVILGAPSLNAASFWVTGNITRTLTDTAYGECMILLDVTINNDCPSRWVSLDCKDTFYPAGQGDRKFSTALAAAFAGKKVSVYVNNAQRHNSYCVGRRVDVLIK